MRSSAEIVQRPLISDGVLTCANRSPTLAFKLWCCKLIKSPADVVLLLTWGRLHIWKGALSSEYVVGRQRLCFVVASRPRLWRHLLGLGTFKPKQTPSRKEVKCL